MPERFETIVIGGGQAGLSVSYHLTQRGREHVVLERGSVAETWRTRPLGRLLPEHAELGAAAPRATSTDGPEPDAFSSLAEVLAYFEGYARDAGARSERASR